jgi:hypothetical protein
MNEVRKESNDKVEQRQEQSSVKPLKGIEKDTPNGVSNVISLTPSMVRTLVKVALRVVRIPTSLFVGIEWFYDSNSSVMNETRSNAQRPSS